MSVYRIGTFGGNSWTPGIEVQGKKKKKEKISAFPVRRAVFTGDLECLSAQV